MKLHQKTDLAYIIGVALGDGNLSNPNGRATRLRISCDLAYPLLIKNICKSLQKLLPENKVSLVKKNNARSLEVSCYSNKLEDWLGWYVGKGPKHIQGVSVPLWIKEKRRYKVACLLGLLQTDGSIYTDRGYTMVTFTSIIQPLAEDVFQIMKELGYEPRMYKINTQPNPRYNIRLVRKAVQFIQEIDFVKQ